MDPVGASGDAILATAALGRSSPGRGMGVAMVPYSPSQ
jgi:hypothetical protein